MKVVLSFLFLLSVFFTVKAQQYKPVDNKSEVKFTIKNFGLNTSGTFNSLKGAISFNASDPAAASFNVTIDVNTINTGNDARDNHLRKDEYFDVEKFPVISFVSKNIQRDQDGYTVTGNLTIKGITKSISFPFTVQNQDSGLLFTGGFSIDRKDFGVGASSAVLGNTVNVSLKVYASKG